MKNSTTIISRRIFCGVMLFCSLLLSALGDLFAQQLAFPGAEGFGKYAIGGRTGTVYHVTNLNNSGAGSLRDAVSSPNRIVVFDVGGVIRITDRIVVSPNIYLAGQTAPGEGITVYGNGWSFSNSHNTICRYIKIRMGAVGTSGKDANGIADGHDIIFDHCSVSWGRDENFSVSGSNALRITIQNSIISQGLLTHSAGGLIQTDGGVTLYRNLYVDNGTRNNKIKGVNQYVNNIVYNWSAGAYIMGGDSEGESFANAVGNCFIQGPVDGTRPFSVGNNKYHIYENDNIQDSNRNGVFDPVLIQKPEFGGGPDFQAVPYNYPVLPTIPANGLLSDNLPVVGASLPYRDYADYYVVNEVKSYGKKGALIGNESVLPFGVPTAWALWPGTARTDTDNDGIPDAWETANGLNPALASDAMIITPSGYTNIENYINGITAAYSQPYLRAPLNLKYDSATQTSISFSWLDYTEKELGFIFERKVNGVFEVIDSTGLNENYFTLTGLVPEEKDTFRVRAYNALGNSGYSNELIAKSKPVEVPVIDPATFVPDLTWTGAANQNWDLASVNWNNSTNTPSVFTDSSKLLFPEGPTQNITIGAQMGPKDIVVNSTGDYNFSGAGFIAGTGSVNKTNTGKLSLLNNNAYNGATVLWNGTLEINKLANGGLASSIGASANYAFNWVLKGGKIHYTGGNTSTDRNIALDASTEFNVTNPASVVTLTGVLAGSGGLIKSGPGRLQLRSANPYEGETVIKGGVLEVTPVSIASEELDIIHNNVAVGTSNILKLQGGTYRTTGGSQVIYENYPFEMYVQDSTENGFEPYRNANLNFNIHGNGKLTYAITYSRELIQGDWTDFTGTLVASGVGTLTGAERSTLMIDNGIGFPSTRVVTAGNTKIASYQNDQTLYLGGLSGISGTSLSCGSKTSGGVITWSVGGAGTNETFAGVINNEAYGSTSNTSGVTTIVKEGSGIWRLTGTNTYSGTTTVTDGTLVVNGNNTGTGKTTVTDGGILAGTGSLSGDVEVLEAELQPGDSSIGTITLKAKLDLTPGSVVKMQLNKNTATCDKVAVQGALVYNGTLQLDTTGTLAEGDMFKIFVPTGTVTGTFAQIIPAIPGPGLSWKFKPATGELLIVSPGFVDAPSNLSLVATTDIPTASSAIAVTWTDNSDNEIYFILERSLDSMNFNDIAHPVSNATNYNNTSLTPDTKYYYRISAVGSTDTSAYSAIVGVKTPALFTTPSLPSNPSPANNAVDVPLISANIDLGWTGSANTDSFAVYFGTGAGNMTKLANVPYSAAPTYQVTGLTNYLTYYWRIDAINAAGTTTGSLWNFRTAAAAAASGDYRAIKTGNWDSTGTGGTVTDIWETYNGTEWVATTVLPGSSVNRITIKTGAVVSLRATTRVNNLVIESGATLKSVTSTRNLRVAGSVINNGTFGSSSSSSERVNFEGYLANGTITLSGTGNWYLVNFNVNNLAQTLEIIIDANLGISSYMRTMYSNATSGTAPVGQDDDNITVTINPGRTVTISGSSSYLMEGSSPRTNTIVEFGNYTYNINGTLEMRTTGTSCIIPHATKANSTITINVNGTWNTGNAMRFAAENAAVAGKLFVNIGDKGVIDAGKGTNNTNMVFYNASNTQYFYNITGNGVLKNRVGGTTSELVFPIGTDGAYCPVRLVNSGTLDLVAVGVKNVFDYPVADPNKVVNRQYSIAPATPNVVNLSISLGWLPPAQAAGFATAAGVVIGHYGTNTWDETSAVLSGAGTIASPYYAKASGFTSFSPFMVGNPNSIFLPLDLLKFNASYNGKKVDVSWSTAREINLKDFTIERSNNGIHFISVGQVTATNNAGGYQFADLQPLSGVSYYRLKMTDKDGSFKYSRIVIINTNLLHTISIYPNPASSSISVTHKMVSKAATMRIYTLDGKLVQNVPLANGTTQTNVDINSLASGYYLVAINDGAVSTRIFVKR
ncbi:MAG: autotransporter-associated beta strand repeat-containing protein [Bacteroidota bacterium]